MTTAEVLRAARGRGVLLIKTKVVTCYSCGTWLARMPLWGCEGDKGDDCHKCGVTSVRVRDGRPVGPRSRRWKEWLSEAMEYADDPVLWEYDIAPSLVLDDRAIALAEAQQSEQEPTDA